MKKALLFISVFLIFTPTKAQVFLGPKAGMNVSTLSNGTEASKRESLSGLNTGVVLNIGINEMFSVQPELSFSQQGFKSEVSVPSNPAAGPVSKDPLILTHRINYLSMPVLMKAAFGHPMLTRGFVHAGPCLGYKIYGKSVLDLNGNTFDPTLFGSEQPTPGAAGGAKPSPSTEVTVGGPSSTEKDPVFDWEIPDSRKFDFGIVVGGGVIFPIGNGELFIDVRYTAGLTPISDRARGEHTGANRVFGTSVGYFFPMGKQ